MQRRLDLAISMIAQPGCCSWTSRRPDWTRAAGSRCGARSGELAEEGVTVLLTTQYLEEADQLADTVAMLDHGRVVARGTPDELKASLGAEVVRLQFADDDGYERALGGLDAVRTDQRLHTIEVATEGSAGEVLQILAGSRGRGRPRAPGVHVPPEPGRRVPVPDRRRRCRLRHPRHGRRRQAEPKEMAR